MATEISRNQQSIPPVIIDFYAKALDFSWFHCWFTSIFYLSSLFVCYDCQKNRQTQPKQHMFLHACKVLWKVLKSGVVEMQCTFKLPLTGSLACCLLVNFCENDLEFPLQMEFIQIIMLYSFFPLLCYPIYYTYFEILE